MVDGAFGRRFSATEDNFCSPPSSSHPLQFPGSHHHQTIYSTAQNWVRRRDKITRRKFESLATATFAGHVVISFGSLFCFYAPSAFRPFGLHSSIFREMSARGLRRSEADRNLAGFQSAISGSRRNDRRASKRVRSADGGWTDGGADSGGEGKKRGIVRRGSGRVAFDVNEKRRKRALRG